YGTGGPVKVDAVRVIVTCRTERRQQFPQKPAVPAAISPARAVDSNAQRSPPRAVSTCMTKHVPEPEIHIRSRCEHSGDFRPALQIVCIGTRQVITITFL